MSLWWAGVSLCAVCGHRHTAVVPVNGVDGEPESGGECPRCGSMSCIALDEDEEADAGDLGV